MGTVRPADFDSGSSSALQPRGAGASGGSNAAERIDQIASIVALLPGAIGSGALVVRMLAALLKRQGVDVAPFQEEIDRFDAANAGLQSAVDDFNTRFPRDGGDAPAPQPDPEADNA